MQQKLKMNRVLMVEGIKEPNRTCREKREINMRNAERDFLLKLSLFYKLHISLTIQPVLNFTMQSETSEETCGLEDICAGFFHQNVQLNLQRKSKKKKSSGSFLLMGSH